MVFGGERLVFVPWRGVSYFIRKTGGYITGQIFVPWRGVSCFPQLTFYWDETLEFSSPDGV